MTLQRGHAVETAMPDRRADPDVVLKVHPGVGWLVAVPVPRFTFSRAKTGQSFSLPPHRGVGKRGATRYDRGEECVAPCRGRYRATYNESRSGYP